LQLLRQQNIKTFKFKLIADVKMNNLHILDDDVASWMALQADCYFKILPTQAKIEREVHSRTVSALCFY